MFGTESISYKTHVYIYVYVSAHDYTHQQSLYIIQAQRLYTKSILTCLQFCPGQFLIASAEEEYILHIFPSPKYFSVHYEHNKTINI